MTDQVSTLLARASAARREGKLKLAAQQYAAVLRLDPAHAEARYFLSVVTPGEDPVAIPATLVRDLFDEYAASYDDHVVSQLGYDGPRLLRSAVDRLIPFSGSLGTVLDIGCGTGLCGVAFHDLATRLVGIDLSPRMIEEARKRDVYDELYLGDFGDTLRRSRSAVDLVVGGDVLGYVGDLRTVLADCVAALRGGGYFAFTAEVASDESTWEYLPGGRFAHGRRYIQEAAVRAGFEVGECGTARLRREHGEPVAGHVVVLRRRLVT